MYSKNGFSVSNSQEIIYDLFIRDSDYYRDSVSMVSRELIIIDDERGIILPLAPVNVINFIVVKIQVVTPEQIGKVQRHHPN